MSQVFISYRNKDEVARQVRALGDRLRRCDIDVVLDQFFLDDNPGGPNEGWDKWSSDGALKTEYVLIVGTEAWFQCFEKNQQPGTGLGAACEADDLRSRIYKAGGVIKTIRVVLFDDADKERIPDKLSRYHCFHAERDFVNIVRWLGGTNSPKVFICHVKRDAATARKLYDLLTQAGANPWVPAEGAVQQEIKKAVADAHAFVVCLSPEFEDSRFREQEVRWAFDEAQRRLSDSGFVVPFIVEPCDLPSWYESLPKGTRIANDINEVIRALSERSGAQLRVPSTDSPELPKDPQPLPPTMRDLQRERDELVRLIEKLEANVRRTDGSPIEELSKLGALREEKFSFDERISALQEGPETFSKEVARLQQALLSNYPGDREKAARGLGEIGAAASSAIPSLEKALRDHSPTVHKAAVWALSEVGTDDALAALIKDPAACLDHVKRLKGSQLFGRARRLLRKLKQEHPSFSKALVAQQLAHCTYNDPDLSAEFRLNEAEKILADVLTDVLSRWDELKDRTEDRKEIASAQETLAIAAAIHKRRWQMEGQTRELLRSCELYRRAFELKLPGHAGYAGVNAAFIDDMLAHRLREDLKSSALPLDSPTPAQQYLHFLEEEAKTIRRAVIQMFFQEQAGAVANWWDLVTVAEAHFGLREYDEAKTWATRARELGGLNAGGDLLQPWQRETTLRQFARLASLQGKDGQSSHAQAVLAELSDHAPLDGVDLGLTGKVGLALSGGGFRASLYHIGVLAALAERDVLRHVEVLSCVSGGSIIGALYYLKVRDLLQSKAEEEIESQDYIELVQKIEQTFLEFVKTNPRMKTFTWPGCWGRWFWDILWRKEIPTSPFAKLLDQDLYGPEVSKDPANARRQDLFLPDLIIQPRHAPPGFNPKYENWRRKDKVPILVLNATTLNTGHNWQFTCTWMGESPAAINPEIDANDRLRRPYYDDLKPPFRNIRLGLAVAASACVPGIFYPLKIGRFYQDGYTVRLVDGGVYDNQGVASLREQDCTVLLVSDASGQNVTEKTPGATRLNVLTRSGDVQGGRVRAEEFERLVQLKQASVLRGLAFVHLKKELGGTPVDWIGCRSDSKAGQAEGGNPINAESHTSYSVRTDLQNCLAAIRTDLDTFNEVESKCLMASGYLMMQKELGRFEKDVPGLCKTKQSALWKFMAAARSLNDPPNDKVKLTLEIGKERFFKFLRFSEPVRRVLSWSDHGPARRIPPVVTLGALVMAIVVLGVLCRFMPTFNFQPWVVFWFVVGPALALLLFFFFGPLYWLSRRLDRIYLDRGRLP
jgi:predicted acylesterase/phospholipase RssA